MMSKADNGFLAKNGLTAYDALKLAGYRRQIFSRESDMYIADFPGLDDFMKANDISFEKFMSRAFPTPPVPEVEFPLQYDPFWEKRAPKNENAAMKQMDRVLETATNTIQNNCPRDDGTPRISNEIIAISNEITSVALDDEIKSHRSLGVMVDTINDLRETVSGYGIEGNVDMKAILPLYAKALIDRYAEVTKMPEDIKARIDNDILSMAETGKIAPVIGEIIKNENIELAPARPERKGPELKM